MACFAVVTMGASQQTPMVQIPYTNYFLFFYPPQYVLDTELPGEPQQTWDHSLVTLCTQDIAVFSQSYIDVHKNPAGIYKIIQDPVRKRLYFLVEFDWVFDLTYAYIYDCETKQMICKCRVPVDYDGESHTTTPARPAEPEPKVAEDTNIYEVIIDEDLLRKPLPGTHACSTNRSAAHKVPAREEQLER